MDPWLIDATDSFFIKATEKNADDRWKRLKIP
jgi:hypothetical protein